MGHSNYICFSEAKEYDCAQYENLLKEIDSEILLTIVRSNKFKFNVTGFMIVDNTVLVIFPKNYNVPDRLEAIQEEASILLKVLLRYRSEQEIAYDENELLSGDTFNSNGRICSGIRLLEDYLINGLLERKIEKEVYSDRGFINWKRTISKTIPLISHGNPIYDKTIIINKSIDNQNMIKKLHQYAIQECLQLWGWLVGADIHNEYVSQPCGIQEAVSILRNELNGVYREREKFVISNLISYYESIGGRTVDSKKEMLVTPYFYWVWEAICGDVFKNQYGSLKRLVPKPLWESTIINASISQRPDILTMRDGTLYIWDAKYYDYNKNVPGWHDAVKQLFYKYTIEQNKKAFPEKIEEIKNVFLLPESDMESYCYLGYIHVNEVEQLGRIQAYALSLKNMMKSYAEGINSKIPEQVMLDIKEK